MYLENKVEWDLNPMKISSENIGEGGFEYDENEFREHSGGGIWIWKEGLGCTLQIREGGGVFRGKKKLHMGQFLQGGKNGRLMSFFF